MTDVVINIIFGAFKAVALVYNIITFVPYYIACQPGQKLKQSKRTKVS